MLRECDGDGAAVVGDEISCDVAGADCESDFGWRDGGILFVSGAGEGLSATSAPVSICFMSTTYK